MKNGSSTVTVNQSNSTEHTTTHWTRVHSTGSHMTHSINSITVPTTTWATTDSVFHTDMKSDKTVNSLQKKANLKWILIAVSILLILLILTIVLTSIYCCRSRYCKYRYS